jgi:hypothetical protein
MGDGYGALGLSLGRSGVMDAIICLSFVLLIGHLHTFLCVFSIQQTTFSSYHFFSLRINSLVLHVSWMGEGNLHS